MAISLLIEKGFEPQVREQALWRNPPRRMSTERSDLAKASSLPLRHGFDAFDVLRVLSEVEAQAHHWVGFLNSLWVG